MRADMLQFFRIVNGRLTHYCYPGAGCTCSNRSDAVTRASRLLMRFVYPKRPKAPQPDEWTSISECSNFEALTLSLGGLGREVFERSVSLMPGGPPPAPCGLPQLDHLALVPAAHVPEVSPQARGGEPIESVDWHALAGSRIAYVRDRIMVPSKQFGITLQAILVGCQDSLAYKHFAGGVTLFDYVSDVKNQCMPALQFYPSLLVGEHAAGKLLAMACGYQHTYQLYRFVPAEGNRFRSATVGASMRTYIRHIYRFKKFPWPLALIGDPEVSEATKDDVGAWFCLVCENRLDIGMGRPLRKMTGTDLAQIRATGILSPFWRRVIYLWADQLVDVDTDDLEIMHGRSKNQSCDLNRWELVAARGVNDTLRQKFRQGAQDRREDRGANPEPTTKATGPACRGRSHKSGLQLFHKLCAARDKELGVLRSNPVSKTYWAIVRTEWDALSPLDRVQYDAIVNGSLQVMNSRAVAISNGIGNIANAQLAIRQGRSRPR
jgi:hypothetical protein